VTLEFHNDTGSKDGIDMPHVEGHFSVVARTGLRQESLRQELYATMAISTPCAASTATIC
jgi:hypothetical protein